MVGNNCISHFWRFIITGLSLVGTIAHTQISDLPLLPGEVYAVTRNDCGVIGKTSEADKFKAQMYEMLWRGKCTNGLVDGMGVIAKPVDFDRLRNHKTDYSFGRELGKSEFPNLINASTNLRYRQGSRHAVIPNVASPYVPRWGDTTKNQFSTSLTGPDGVGIQTWQLSCYVDLNLFRGCGSGNEFQVYGVKIWKAPDFYGTTTWCPNPKTPVGCEELWQQKAEPIIVSIKAFIDEVEKKDAADKQVYAELYRPWAEREAAKKIAAAAEAKRVAALAAIALVKDKEIALAEQQERDEIDAKEKAKAARLKIEADQAYTTSLGKMNAGALFALADKKRAGGEPDKAREAFLALITKFPNNPLVAVAAQEMLKLPAAVLAPTAEPPPVKTVAIKPAVAASQTKKRDDSLEDMAGALGANKK